HVYRIIRSGEVRVNKGRASADSRVNTGDLVRLPPVRISERVAEKAEAMAQSMARDAPARSLPILFEDDHLIAIDKPSGVAVHGGSGVSFGVIEQLRMARPQAKFLELARQRDGVKPVDFLRSLRFTYAKMLLSDDDRKIERAERLLPYAFSYVYYGNPDDVVKITGGGQS
ncbi:MAG: hypothetical protein WCQ26_11430, partial [Pseudanabaena sp. ELA748]